VLVHGILIARSLDLRLGMVVTALADSGPVDMGYCFHHDAWAYICSTLRDQCHVLR
jgi:hypothetical protein